MYYRWAIVIISCIAVWAMNGFLAWAQELPSGARAALESKSEHLQKAEALIELMDYGKTVESMLEQWPFNPFSRAARELGIENLPDEKKAEVEKWIRDFCKEQFANIKVEHLEKTAAKIMAEIYTTEELDALLAFYKSEAGQSYLKKHSEFTRRMAAEYEEAIAKGLHDLLSQAPKHIDALRRFILQGKTDKKDAPDETN